MSVEKPSVRKVLESYGMVDILRVEGSSIPLYCINFPKLSEEEQRLLAEARERVMWGAKEEPTGVPLHQRKDFFMNEILGMMEKLWKKIPPNRKKFLATLLTDECVGYGPIEPMLDDENLEDIMIIGVGMPVYVFHQKHGMCSSNVVFQDETVLRGLMEKASLDAGRRRIDVRSPLLDTRMPDGSRLNLIVPPISLTGPLMSIRRFRKQALNIVDLIKLGALSVNAGAFIWLLVEGMGVRPSNLLIAGGTGCGKTTTLSAVSVFVPERERVVSIEDPAELCFPHGHWIRLETRLPAEGLEGVTLTQLVKNALRMRPDRLVIGEARGPEIPDIFSAFSGHVGCMSTIHTNTTAEETLARLTKQPVEVPELLLSALDAIIMEHRLYLPGRKHVRRITEVAEIAGMEGNRVKLNRTHRWNPAKDKLEVVDTPSIAIKQISELSGISRKEINQELKQREKILKWMVEKSLNTGEIYKKVQEYYSEPKAVLEEMNRRPKRR